MHSSDKEVPPTLGYVILISVWRYLALPAVSIAIVYGFRERLSLKAFLHDPAFVSTYLQRGVKVIELIHGG